MGIFNNTIAKLSDYVREKLNPAQNSIVNDFGQTKASDHKLLYKQSFEKIEAVNRGVSMVVNGCASLDYDIKDSLPSSIAPGIKKRTLHNLLNFRPNPYQSAQNFRINIFTDIILEGNAFIKEVSYISSEQAAEQLKQELGEDFNTFLGFNPLLPLMEIKLKPDYTEENNISQLKDFISKNSIVKEVYFQESLLDAINKNIRNISLIILGFSAVLFFIAGALINNTIRLALYAKRMLIKSMKLVGATRNFIRKPFIVRGILQGFIGAVIANIMILMVFYYAKKQIPEIIAFENPVNLSIVLGIVVFLGIFISGFSTYFAVNKYLRQRTEDIF